MKFNYQSQRKNYGNCKPSSYWWTTNLSCWKHLVTIKHGAELKKDCQNDMLLGSNPATSNENVARPNQADEKMIGDSIKTSAGDRVRYYCLCESCRHRIQATDGVARQDAPAVFA